MQNKFNVQRRLLLAFALFSLLPICLLGYGFLLRFEQVLLDDSLRFLREGANLKAEQINNYLEERLQDINNLAQSVDTKANFAQLAHLYQTQGINSKRYKKNDLLLRQSYQSYIKENGYYDLFFLDMQGNVVFTVLHEADFATNLIDGSYKYTGLASSFLQTRLTLESVISQIEYYGPSKEPAAFLATPLIIDGKLSGVLALQINTKRFQHVVSGTTGLGETGEVAVGRREGKGALFLMPLKYDSDAALKRQVTFQEGLALPMINAVQGNHGSGISIDYRNKEVVAAWRYIPLAKMGMVVKIDLNQALRPATELWKQGFLIMAGLALLVLITAWFISTSMVRPIRTLTRVADKIAKGDLSQRVNIDQRDEVGQLAESFNIMAENVQSSQEMLEARVAHRTHELTHAIEQVTTEKVKLAQSEALRSAIINNASYIIISTDPEGTITSFNRVATWMLGYSEEELIGKQTPALFHDREEVVNYAEELSLELGQTIEPGFEVFVIKTKMGADFDDREWTYIHKEGKRIPVRLTVTALYDGNLQIIGFLGIAEDITQQKADQEGLRLAAKVFQNAGEAILVTDEQARIIDVNPAYLEITGFSKEDAIGQNPSISRSGHHDDLFYQKMWDTIHALGTWSGEIWDRRKNGEVYPKFLTITSVKNERGKVINYVGTFKDVSHQKLTEEKLEKLAYYDPLTSLPNRALFRDRLERDLKLVLRHHNSLALMFIDLDRFKYVNDTLGHEAGDQLLITVSRRLESCVRASDTVARLGGDEFTVVLSDVEEDNQVGHVAANIIKSLQEVVKIGEQDAFVGASIGISLYPGDGEDATELIKNADTAMYRAKDAGRGNYKFFTSEMDQTNQDRMELENKLRRAIENFELKLFYQPKHSLLTGERVGFEALIRWDSPELGLVTPDRFIPLAEENGMILEIGQWVLNEACRQMSEWIRLGMEKVSVAVNLSARQFKEPALAAKISQVLDKYNLPADRLELEITETAVIENADESINTIFQLKELGVKISMDDFGTGYSSLSYLQKFPFDSLKIDLSFVQALESDPNAGVIVESILALAKGLKLTTIAEGVETEKQRDFLNQLDCQYAQGYLYSRPVKAEEIEI